jgi:hypothetical protein
MLIGVIILLSLCFASPVSASGGTYWISPNGRDSARGTQADPFASPEAALRKAGGGNTFIFRPGYYRGPVLVRREYAGTPQRPTIFKAEVKYQARISGSPDVAFHVWLADWVIIDGLDISGGTKAGIVIDSNNCVVRNSHVHNNIGQGIGVYGRSNVVIERNLIEYNGEHPHFDHGIYAQGTAITIRDNIVRCNAAFGLHLYPAVDHSTIENNLIHNNWRYGILLCSKPGVGSNVIANNTIVGNGEGIGIENGHRDKVFNNIIVGNRGQDMKDAIGVYGRGSLAGVEIGNNLCEPECRSGTGNIKAAPGFVDLDKQVFYLTRSSPARGMGNRRYVPAYDFFGLPRDPNTPADIGCFQYDDRLAGSGYRQSWPYQWPFEFSSHGTGLPDLWKSPGPKSLDGK